MYINTVSSTITGIRKFLRGVSEKAEFRVTTLGEYKGIRIAIDNFKSKEGETLQKRYVLWNNDIQLTWYKNKNSKGKFELIG